MFLRSESGAMLMFVKRTKPSKTDDCDRVDDENQAGFENETMTRQRKL